MNSNHPSADDWRNKTLTPDSGPAFISLNASGRCNLSCFMCSHSMLDEIPINIEKNNLAPFLERAQSLYFGGGEPLWISKKSNPIAHDFFNMIVNNYPHLKLGVYTNGTLLDENMINILFKRFHAVHFSLDTMDPKLYEKIRGKNLLNRLLENIRALSMMKKKAGLKYCDKPLININTIVMNSTLDGLPAIARFAREIDANIHVLIKMNVKLQYDFEMLLKKQYKKNDIGEEKAKEVTRLHINAVQNESFNSKDIPEEKLDKISKEIMGIYAGSDIFVEDQVPIKVVKNNVATKPLPPKDSPICSLPWVGAHIQENGNVLCCCASNAILGNVGKQSFEEIWKGEAAQELRKSFITGEMKGCIQQECPKDVDYFAKNDIFSQRLLDNLRKEFLKQRIDSILLLRTAPFFKTKLIAKTLIKSFPFAELTIITNPSGEDICSSWGSNINVITYPKSRFMPEEFKIWWQGISSKKYGFVASIFQDDTHSFNNVTETMGHIDAYSKHKIFVTGDIFTLRN